MTAICVLNALILRGVPGIADLSDFFPATKLFVICIKGFDGLASCELESILQMVEYLKTVICTISSCVIHKSKVY